MKKRRGYKVFNVVARHNATTVVRNVENPLKNFIIKYLADLIRLRLFYLNLLRVGSPSVEAKSYLYCTSDPA